MVQLVTVVWREVGGVMVNTQTHTAVMHQSNQGALVQMVLEVQVGLRRLVVLVVWVVLVACLRIVQVPVVRSSLQ